MQDSLNEDDLTSLLDRLATRGSVGRPEMHNGFLMVRFGDLALEARVAGSDLGRRVLAFAVDLGPEDSFLDEPRMRTLLHQLGGTAAVRAICAHGRLWLEARLAPEDYAPERLDDVVEWRLAELGAVAQAWHGTRDATPLACSLAELVASTPVEPHKALLVASVGFGVAGADGDLSPCEAARLRAWLQDIPSFRALPVSRVIDAIAALVSDPPRTLYAALRGLDTRERTLAWALANDMAHADGFTDDDERRYLSTVASVFKLDARDLAPFVAEAQRRAVHRASQRHSEEAPTTAEPAREASERPTGT
ncbi:MAG: TerB family tellurite resistance protein [Deltaproteobacteria bacterium]|nr:TerB family tellurite resistance protein [Deltaproteobacteria bacterium]